MRYTKLMSLSPIKFLRLSTMCLLCVPYRCCGVSTDVAVCPIPMLLCVPYRGWGCPILRLLPRCVYLVLVSKKLYYPNLLMINDIQDQFFMPLHLSYIWNMSNEHRPRCVCVELYTSVCWLYQYECVCLRVFVCLLSDCSYEDSRCDLIYTKVN